jgi:hypothetical protein
MTTNEALTAPMQPIARPKPCPLDDVAEFCSRFIYAKPCEIDALAIWIAHTYVYTAFGYSPRLGAFAPKEGAGKSTVLKMALALANKPIKTMNASHNAIYSIIAQLHPTLLFDESDNIFGKNGSGDKGRLIRGILNEGVEEDGHVLRVVNGTAEQFPVFGAAAFAGIGQLPKTMMSRCVLINLKEAPIDAGIEQYDKALYAGEAAKIKEALQAWVLSRGAELNLYPEMPDGFYNRAGQIWRVMVSIGDAAGPAWGKRARDAAMELALGITSKTKMSPAEDLIQVVASYTLESVFLPTTDLIDLLRTAQAEGQILWASWLVDPIIAARQISNMLKPYGIESKQKWLEGENRRGYYAADFHLWARPDEPIAAEVGRTIAANGS